MRPAHPSVLSNPTSFTHSNSGYCLKSSTGLKLQSPESQTQTLKPPEPTCTPASNVLRVAPDPALSQNCPRLNSESSSVYVLYTDYIVEKPGVTLKDAACAYCRNRTVREIQFSQEISSRGRVLEWVLQLYLEYAFRRIQVVGPALLGLDSRPSRKTSCHGRESIESFSHWRRNAGPSQSERSSQPARCPNPIRGNLAVSTNIRTEHFGHPHSSTKQREQRDASGASGSSKCELAPPRGWLSSPAAVGPRSHHRRGRSSLPAADTHPGSRSLWRCRPNSTGAWARTHPRTSQRRA